MKWILVVEVQADKRNEAISKLVDKVPFMLMNDITKDGDTTLELVESEKPKSGL